MGNHKQEAGNEQWNRRPDGHFSFLSFVFLCVLCVSVVNPLRANPPVASYLFPAGGQRGTTVPVHVGGLFLYKSCNFELLGPGVTATPALRNTRTLWFDGPLLPLPESQQAEDYPKDMVGEIRIVADAPLGARRGRLWTAEGAASGLTFIVGDLPEIVEQEIDGDPVPVLVKLPVTINGRIFPHGNVDDWSFALRKGQTATCEVNASRLGSPLDARLQLFDPRGRVVAENDDHFGTDPFLRFTAKEDGVHRVRVADANFKGGQAFVYRLTLTTAPHVAPVAVTQPTPTAPGFRLSLIGIDPKATPTADAVTLLRGGQVKLRVNAERFGGFADAIPLTIDGLPDGVKATNTIIAAKQNQVDVTLTAEKTAAIGAVRLSVRSGTQTAALRAPSGQAEVDSILLGVALPVPFKIVGDFDMRWASRGSVYRRKYHLERNGFDGPVEISIADRQARHLQGVTGPVVTLPPGTTDFEYPITLPPWMETGRTCRVCVQAVGVVKEGSTEHVVGFSATNQNDQMIAVVETGRLGVEASKTSLAATPGGSATLTVKVARGKGVAGAAKVELVLPPHVHGVHAEPVVIAAGQSTTTFTIRFDRDKSGPFNVPALLRATIEDASGTITAETRVEIAPAD